VERLAGGERPEMNHRRITDWQVACHLGQVIELGLESRTLDAGDPDPDDSDHQKHDQNQVRQASSHRMSHAASVEGAFDHRLRQARRKHRF
jgi:hypothetical protein